MNGLTYLLAALALVAVLVAALEWRRAARAQAEAERAAAERASLLTRQRDQFDALRLALAQLDGLGEAALGGLLLLDRHRRILWGNQAAWHLFGAESPATGQAFIALVHDVDLNQTVVDALSGGRPIVRQTAVDERTLRIRAVPIQLSAAARLLPGEGHSAEDPGDGGVAVAVEDVTELQRLGRARRDLVANISHELRTPLANIDLAAQTLRNVGTADPDLQDRMLDQIQSYVQTLSQLSQEMMDLAQIESGQVLLKLLPVELGPLVDRAVRMLRPQAEVRRQDLAVAIPPGLIALADEQQVMRVVGNLVHNAIKFTPEGGAIRVAARAADPDDIEVSVTDTGPGIPQLEQVRIFERFYKADRARSRGGTGLGLAIARHIVEGHGGRIWLESPPGHGARFLFTLPKA